MKKNFKYYAVAWLLLLALFNVLTFIIPAYPAFEKYTDSFWIGWSVSIVAFLGQLVCAWLTSKDDLAQKTFYHVSLFRVSCIGLITTFIAALICMVITPLPYWCAAVLCLVVLVANAVTIVKAKTAIELISSVDEKTESATAFIYEMRAESESLFKNATSDEERNLCKAVYEAFQYSDPMSNAALAAIETEIRTHFIIWKDAIIKSERERAVAESKPLLNAIADRNNKCKNLK